MAHITTILPCVFIWTMSARTACDVSVMFAFWAHSCSGMAISRTCFSEVITTRCESRKSELLELLGEILAGLEPAPPLPLRAMVSEPVRLAVAEPPGMSAGESFHWSAFRESSAPVESMKPMFRIGPFRRKMQADEWGKDGQRKKMRWDDRCFLFSLSCCLKKRRANLRVGVARTVCRQSTRLS